MQKDSLRISSALRKGDFRKLAYWNMFGKNRVVLFSYILLLLVGILGILFARNIFILFALSIVFLVCPLLVIVMAEYNIFKVNKAGGIQERTNVTYEFAACGITAFGPGEQVLASYPWQEIYRVYENKHFYIIFVNAVEMLTIAKRDLAEQPGSEVLLREILGESVPVARRFMQPTTQ